MNHVEKIKYLKDRYGLTLREIADGMTKAGQAAIEGKRFESLVEQGEVYHQARRRWLNATLIEYRKHDREVRIATLQSYGREVPPDATDEQIMEIAAGIEICACCGWEAPCSCDGWGQTWTLKSYWLSLEGETK